MHYFHYVLLFTLFIIQFTLTFRYFCPTEEEISNMRSELEKYGIQMPAFSKIGGILANELSVDEAACKSWCFRYIYSDRTMFFFCFVFF